MLRAEFLRHTGISSEALKSLRVRGLLPFQEDKRTEGNWREFTDDDVVALGNMVKLSRLGLSCAAAKMIVTKRPQMVATLIEMLSESPTDGDPTARG